jgi:hypothetical protein
MPKGNQRLFKMRGGVATNREHFRPFVTRAPPVHLTTRGRLPRRLRQNFIANYIFIFIVLLPLWEEASAGLRGCRGVYLMAPATVHRGR